MAVKRFDIIAVIVGACVVFPLIAYLYFYDPDGLRKPNVNAVFEQAAAEQRRADFTERYHTEKSFISTRHMDREHVQAAALMIEAIPAAFEAQLVEQGNQKRPVFQVRLEAGGRSIYWHLVKYPGRQTASLETKERGTHNRPPKGFATFRSRFERYVLQGYCKTSQIASLRDALPTQEFVVHEHEAD